MRGGALPWTWHPRRSWGPLEKMKRRQQQTSDRGHLLEYRSWRQYIYWTAKKKQVDRWRLESLNRSLNLQPLVRDPAAKIILQPATADTTRGLRKNSRAARSMIPRRGTHKQPLMAAGMGTEDLTAMPELEFIHYLVETGTPPSWFAKNKIYCLSNGSPIMWPWESTPSDGDTQPRALGDYNRQKRHNSNSKSGTRQPHNQRGKRARERRQPHYYCLEHLCINTNWQTCAAVADPRIQKTSGPNPLVPPYLPNQDMASGTVVPAAEGDFDPAPTAVAIGPQMGLRGGSLPGDENQDLQQAGEQEMHILFSKNDIVQEVDVENDFLTRYRRERAFERELLLKYRVTSGSGRRDVRSGCR